MIPILDQTAIDTDPRFAAILNRDLSFDPAVEASVRDILTAVRTRGDAAAIEYTERFDGVHLDSLEPVSPDDLRSLHSQVSGAFIDALRGAIANVRDFHAHQLGHDIWVEKPGIRMGLRVTPLDSVGLYVPGGAGAYPSTIVMNAVPAQVAGVRRIAAVTPPGQFRNNPHVAAAFVELGITEVYTIGGAQAVAALAYGTKSIPRVDKIVGPGNIYVAVAKRQVFGMVDIDMIAGPSEIVVVADEHADPAFAAADMLSQAEHGSGREMAVLVTPSRRIAEEVQEELKVQIATLPHPDKVSAVIDANAIVVVRDLAEAAEVVNRIAPEHLELMVEDHAMLLSMIRHAGAIFLGSYSPEPISDYYGGANHVLPTSGAARYASPLGVYDFQKWSNVVAYTPEAAARCCDAVALLARAEGFEAHARSIERRCRNDR